jgi:hypothetical protein
VSNSARPEKQDHADTCCPIHFFVLIKTIARQQGSVRSNGAALFTPPPRARTSNEGAAPCCLSRATACSGGDGRV